VNKVNDYSFDNLVILFILQQKYKAAAKSPAPCKQVTPKPRHLTQLNCQFPEAAIVAIVHRRIRTQCCCW